VRAARSRSNRPYVWPTPVVVSRSPARVRQSRREVRLLQGRDRDGTLADAHADGLAGNHTWSAARLKACSSTPACVQPGLSRECRCRSASRSRTLHEFSHAVIPNRSRPGKIDVAGLRDCLAHVQESMLLVVAVSVAAAGQCWKNPQIPPGTASGCCISGPPTHRAAFTVDPGG